MKTRTLSSRKVIRFTESAALLTVALALSLVESLIPIQSIIPLPGFKLGLANMAVVVAFFRISPLSGAVVALGKALITSLLFSGISSFIYSVAGSVLSFAALMFSAYILKDRVGFVGMSVLMALFHNVGQIAAAALVTGNFLILSYFPYLVAAAIVFGALNGVILSFLPKNIYVFKEFTDD